MSSKSPDEIYGDRVANLLHEFAAAIGAESGASGVEVTCSFKWHADVKSKNGRGNLKMRSFITPDATVERLLDPKVKMPRGSRLTHEALVKMKSAVRRINIKIGGQ